MKMQAKTFCGHGILLKCWSSWEIFWEFSWFLVSTYLTRPSGRSALIWNWVAQCTWVLTNYINYFDVWIRVIVPYLRTEFNMGFPNRRIFLWIWIYVAHQSQSATQCSLRSLNSLLRPHIIVFDSTETQRRPKKTKKNTFWPPSKASVRFSFFNLVHWSSIRSWQTHTKGSIEYTHLASRITIATTIPIVVLGDREYVQKAPDILLAHPNAFCVILFPFSCFSCSNMSIQWSPSSDHSCFRAH